MVSCQNGPTRHAYAWQIGPFWQDTLDVSTYPQCYRKSHDCVTDELQLGLRHISVIHGLVVSSIAGTSIILIERGFTTSVVATFKIIFPILHEPMIAFVVLWCEIQEVVLKASDWTSPGLDGNGTLYLWREMKSLGWCQMKMFLIKGLSGLLTNNQAHICLTGPLCWESTDNRCHGFCLCDYFTMTYIPVRDWVPVGRTMAR